jgi:hypothetical protein
MQGESYQLVSLGSFSTIYVTSDLVKHRTWLTFKGLLFKKNQRFINSKGTRVMA